jgi:hypothetical protein
MNYALMGNLQNSFEPWDYEETKGISEWEKVM